MFEYLGLIAVLASWAAGFYLLSRWRGARGMSISEHAASAPTATTFFMATLSICGALFYLWCIRWLNESLSLGPTFTVLITVSLVLLLIAVFIPDMQSWKRVLHRAAAYSVAFLFLPMSYLVLQSPAISEIALVIGLVCVAYMVFACFLFIFSKKSKQYYLIFQSLYIVAFQLALLSAAYL